MKKHIQLTDDMQIHQAVQFVEVLTGSLKGNVDFRAMKKGAPTVKFSSSDARWSELFCTLNTRGYEIYACINETDGNGQKKENIVRVRVLVIDCDNPDTGRYTIESLPISPTAIVSSSHGKYHIYYRVNDCELAQFTWLQKALAAKLGGDPAVSDISRVMRVPGSFNRKRNKPFFSTIIEHSNNEYDVRDIVDAFGFDSFVSTDTSGLNKNIVHEESPSFASNIISILKGEQLHASSLSLAAQLRFKNLHETEISRTLRELFNASNTKRDERFFERENDILRLTLDACKFADAKRKPVGVQPIDTEVWDIPEPLEETLAAVAPLPIEVLPRVIKDIAIDEAERIGCPVDFVVTSLLVCAGSFVARNYQVQPKLEDSGWQISPNLWGILVGAPSSKKSPSMKFATSAVWDIQNKLNNEFEYSQKDRDVSEELDAMQESANKSQAKRLLKQGNRSEAEALLRADKDNSKEVIHQRVILGDCTTEKAGEVLSENSRGLLLVRDELSGLFKSLEKSDRVNDRSFYLESYNGLGSYVYDRIGRGTVVIPTLRLSIVGGIQPEVFKNIVVLPALDGTNGDGLLQRFQLAVFPDIQKGRHQVDRKPNVLAQKQYADVLNTLMEENDEA